MKAVTLADVSKNGRGYYGIGASAVPFSDELYTYLRITDINDDGTLNMNDLKSVDDESASEYLLEPNDIVFARTGASTGRNYFYDGSDGEFVYAGFLIKFSIDPIRVNPKYIKYYCQSAKYKGWIQSFNTGSTRGNINAKTLAQMPIPLIPREQQDVLVSVLSSLDEKIKNNNEVNKNLEQQIKTLYTYYFVDGRKDDWKEIPLSEIIFFQEGPGIRNWQYVEDGVKFINIHCISNGEIDTSTANKISNAEASGKYSHFMLEPYDIVMSCSGTLGRYAIVQQKDLPLCLNTSVIRFRPKHYDSDYSYVYGYMTSNEFLNQQQMMANGSAQVNFGQAVRC